MIGDFLINIFFISSCFIQDEDFEHENKQFFLETDFSIIKAVSIFDIKLSTYGHTSIPILLKSWNKTLDYGQLALVSEATY